MTTNRKTESPPKGNAHGVRDAWSYRERPGDNQQRRGDRSEFLPRLVMPIEASDANIVGQKWLLAVGVAVLFRPGLDAMPKSPPAGNGSCVPEESERIDGEPLRGEAELVETANDMATM